MRILRYALFAAFTSLAAANACIAAELPVKIKARVDKKEAFIGEKIKYTISVTSSKDTDIEFPDLTDAFKGMTLLDTQARKRGFFNKNTRTLRVLLQTYTPGKYTVLKQAIRYKRRHDADWNTALTEECVITIVSLLEKAGAKAGLADIKGPLDIRNRWQVIVLLTAAALAIILIFRKRIFAKKKKSSTAIQPWKAHEVAYSQLEELRKKGLLARGFVKQYYSELSDILRHYLENRFSLKAPEMTTEEFIAYMREYSQLAREQKDLLKSFLGNCDLVKFARYIPPEGEGETAFDTAKRFVDQTRSADEDKDPLQQKK